jgi:hypothetical protein
MNRGVFSFDVAVEFRFGKIDWLKIGGKEIKRDYVVELVEYLEV